MTGQLRTTLRTRADDLGAWDVDVDVDSIVRAGGRRVRRRRAAVAGGVAGVVAVVGGVVALTGLHSAPTPPPVDGTTKPLSYAVGRVIHTGDTVIDTGTTIGSMVPVGDGFIVSGSDVRGPDRTVYLVKDGHTHSISYLSDHASRLFASDDGLVAAWSARDQIVAWPFMPNKVVENKTRSFGAAATWPSDSPPHVQALSDGHLWFWDGRAHWIGEVRPIRTTFGWHDTNPPGSGTVVDAAGDQILVREGDGMAVTTANLHLGPRIRAGGDLAGVRTQVKDVDDGDLAPDGKHWFATGTDQIAVFDSATGRREEPAHPGFAFAAPYQWLDSDTMAVLARPTLSGDAEVSLLTCRVSTDSCTLAAADVGTADQVVLPDGLPTR